ncbi:hypothetical protein [Agaribacterium sp. ZY112]|uniref:HzsA-related protein n=1 Tax=Agaribacterium sp. ZY112 TaxID=3233574 RepID=UPI00352423B0
MTYTKFTFLGMLASAVLALTGCDASSGFDESIDHSEQSDPVVVDYPIAYIERPVPRDEDGQVLAYEALAPAAFKPGARLILKDRAQVSAPSRDLTSSVFTNCSDISCESEEAEESTEESTIALYDVKDISVSHDGSKLLFAMRAPEDEDLDEDEQATWNIWQYDHESKQLSRVISSDIQAEQGQDVAPSYLSDGRIVFSSTRQPRAKAILLDENKPQFDPGTEADREEPTFVLHVMDENGENIQQISYNQSHDLDPVQLSNGRIAFVRWDNYRRGEDRVSLYSMEADGSDTSLLFGYHSITTGTEGTEAIRTKPIQLQDGRLLVRHHAREVLSQGGDLSYIDQESYVDFAQGFSGSSLTKPGQESATDGISYTNDGASPRGFYNSAYPLFDGSGRIMASWSGCLVEGTGIGTYLNNDGFLVDGLARFVDEDGELLSEDANPITPLASDVDAYPCGPGVSALEELSIAEPRYGIWTLDTQAQTARPVTLAKDNYMYSDVVIMQPRPLPDFPDTSTPLGFQKTLIEENLGVVHIHSIYEFDGFDTSPAGASVMADPEQTPIEDREARFLRLVKAVSMPNRDVYDFDGSAFGFRSGGQMKDILGYVPIEPDGSVKFLAPANVAFSFSIVDANGHTLDGNLGQEHRNWLSLAPGESRECGGCHLADDPSPHGRLEAEADFSYAGALGGQAFANTQLRDAFGTGHPDPEVGDTMAEYAARMQGPRRPTVDLIFSDDWTDTSITDASPDISLLYADLPIEVAPTNEECQEQWYAECRVVINYPTHIAPLWEVDRRVFDESDPELVIADNTCISCHSRTDENGADRVPDAQLELSNQQSQDRDDYVTSYVELLRADVPQVLDENGVLVNEQIEVPAVDENGDPVFIVNELGQTVQATMLVDVAAEPAPIRGMARDSDTFFDLFMGGSHTGRLNPAELKLIAEWLDIGAQYYNNPFEAPE